MNKSIIFVLCTLLYVPHTRTILSDDDIRNEDIEITFYELLDNILFLHAADGLHDPSLDRTSVQHIILSDLVKGTVEINNLPNVVNIFYNSSKVTLHYDKEIKAKIIDIKDSGISIEQYPELIDNSSECAPSTIAQLSWSDLVSEYIMRALEYLIQVP